MDDAKKGEVVFDGAGNQDENSVKPTNVKTVSLGWGEDEMRFSQTEIQVPQESKNRKSYFFVKHP